MDSKKEKHDKKEKSKDKKHDHREVKPSLSLSSLERIPKTGLTHKLTPEQCPIEFVTVYGDRAEVTRTLSLEITQEGIQDLVVGGLPPNVDPNSIRVSGGAGYAIILEVSYNVTFPETLQSEAPPELLERQQQLTWQRRKVAEQKDRLQMERQWVVNFSVEKQKITEKSNTSVEEARQLLKFYSEQLQRIDEAILEVDRTLTEIDKKLLTINNEIQEKKVTHLPERREVTISIAATQKGRVIVQLSYVVTDARWISSYDARVSTTQNKGSKANCQLIYNALITNTTNEDWKDVKLALSTAVPSAGGQPPKLRTVKVYFTDDPEYLRASRPLPQRRSSIAMLSKESEFIRDEDTKKEKVSSSPAASPPPQPSPPPAVKQLTTTVEQGTSCATYHIPRAATVLADNKPHKVTVMMCQFEMELSYVTVPVLSPNVFVKGVAKNTSQYQFLSGKMNVFLDNFFIAQSYLKHTNPSEEIELYLGVDNGIKVELRPQEVMSGKSGNVITGKKKTQNFKNAIWLKNTKNTTVEVQASDQLPLSSNSELKVTLVEPTIKEKGPVSIDEHNNIVWKINLQPEQETILYYHYKIEYPSDKDIVMMN